MRLALKRATADANPPDSPEVWFSEVARLRAGHRQTGSNPQVLINAVIVQVDFSHDRGLFSFHDAEIITALAKLTGDTFLAEPALPIVELGSGDYPSS